MKQRDASLQESTATLLGRLRRRYFAVQIDFVGVFLDRIVAPLVVLQYLIDQNESSDKTIS